GPVVAVGLILYPAVEWAAGQAAASEVLRPLVSPRVRFDAWGGGFRFLP
ncbi:MAG: hypothetical protein HOY78_10970, partial [Saccharothrix sp.]|nr:hypothetical protein [Saccharothrix sp.]